MTGYANKIYCLLKEQKLSLCMAESATGGLLSHLMTNINGVSEVFLGGVCTYANSAKESLLGVSEIDLKNYGAVSEPVVRQMALGACQLFQADLSLCDTGIAGPTGGSNEKPVGLFYLAVCWKGKVTVKRHIFKGDRASIKEHAALTALQFLGEILENR